MSENTTYQKCPNCGRLNDVSIFVSGQKVSCHFCGIRFEVHRTDPGVKLESPPPLTKQEMELLKKAPKIHGYEIYSVIGYGGMGVIYLARQSSLQRDVAIKVLSEKWVGQEVILRRFHREAAALASLSHPNIITIIDKGEIEGQPYFVMEYIKGRSLRNVINRAPVKTDAFVGYIVQVCRGLSHAHERKFVHRDLKPENLLIDSNNNIKIADFGLAALIDPDLSSDHMTKSRVAMGTISYMAPEQRKDAKSVDFLADIYSLGVVMYEMMTRTLPMGAVRPPSQVHPEADPRFDELIIKCLDPDPKARPESAEKVKDTVRDLVAQEPQTFAPSTGQVTSLSPHHTGIYHRKRRQRPGGFQFLDKKWKQAALIAGALIMLIFNLYLLFSGDN
ncbi:MAG: hypothetical protein Kow0090_04480 [Myxococcota bacterium]